MNSLNLQKQRYRYLAYIVVRDAIGFYFGIPQFLAEDNLDSVFVNALQEKLKEVRKEKGRSPTPKEVNRIIRLVKRSLNARVKELEEDFATCKDVLFNRNIWLELLDLNEDFFKVYLPNLDDKLKKDLSVVPKWGTRDHSLGRTYINDNFNLSVNFNA